MPINPVLEADWREVSLLPFTEATKGRNFIDELQFLNGRAVFRRVTYDRDAPRPRLGEVRQTIHSFHPDDTTSISLAARDMVSSAPATCCNAAASVKIRISAHSVHGR